MSPNPINLGGAGSIDMYPDDTYAAAQTVQGAGATFGQVWQSLHAGIQAAEQKLGHGPMGRNFAAGYNAFAASVVPAVDNAEKLFSGLGQLGAQGVQLYLHLDGQVIPQLFHSMDSAENTDG
ncbi:hypothetical protein [Kribbella sp. NPDC055071]